MDIDMAASPENPILIVPNNSYLLVDRTHPAGKKKAAALPYLHGAAIS